MAAARLLPVGSTALLCAGPGVERELVDRGVQVVHEGDADAVIVGFHRDFDFERMAIAARAVHRGARLVATNDDATYPTPEGLLPGGGAILASIERATGTAAVVAGKPNAPMAEVVTAMVGPTGVMVGDRPDTDGCFARVLGYQFALVLSGVTTTDDLPVEPHPDHVASDLAQLVERHVRAQVVE
jgi:4-nitrophenyl phosphatase